MKTLLEGAKANYLAAEHLLTIKLDDENMINIIGYHLQQALELGIKHMLEINGIKYPKTHDITDLISLVPEEFQNIFSDVEVYSEVITMWESKTRYVKNFLLACKSIEKIKPLINQCLINIDQIVGETKEFI